MNCVGDMFGKGPVSHLDRHVLWLACITDMEPRREMWVANPDSSVKEKGFRHGYSLLLVFEPTGKGDFGWPYLKYQKYSLGVDFQGVIPV